MVRCESRSSTIGHITLGTKQTGAPSAGNPHAGCDVAGAGNGFTVWLLRHSQRKRGETARLDLRNTAPVLDPTLVLYLERPRATGRVRMRFGRALLIQRLEGSRPQGSLGSPTCTNDTPPPHSQRRFSVCL